MILYSISDFDCVAIESSSNIEFVCVKALVRKSAAFAAAAAIALKLHIVLSSSEIIVPRVV